MNDDYVKRSDVHKVFQPKYAPAINKTFAAMIDSVPAADVAEVRHGRWYLDNGCAFCSECKNSFNPKIKSQALFCPRCGAKMQEGMDEIAEWQYKTMSVPGGKGQTYAKWSCSACNGKQKHRSRYCPDCGKRMKNGGQDDV